MKSRKATICAILFGALGGLLFFCGAAAAQEPAPTGIFAYLTPRTAYGAVLGLIGLADPNVVARRVADGTAQRGQAERVGSVDLRPGCVRSHCCRDRGHDGLCGDISAAITLADAKDVAAAQKRDRWKRHGPRRRIRYDGQIEVWTCNRRIWLHRGGLGSSGPRKDMVRPTTDPVIHPGIMEEAYGIEIARAREFGGGMFSSLPEKYGVHPVLRQWIPKAKSKTDGASPPRPGKLLDKVTGIVVGDIGWPGLTAADAAKDLGQSFGHFLIDDNAIIECVPALTSSVGIVEQARFVETRTPAGAVDAHETTLAINLCFGGPAGGKVAFDHCVALVACLCHQLSWTPPRM